jgi:hypothetical protein
MKDPANSTQGKKRQRRLSILSAAGNTRRVDALFKAMSADFLLREQFVTDPSQVLSEYVHGERLSPEVASVRNQFLYAVMSNHHLLRWMHAYATHHGGRIPSSNRFMADFGHAVAQHEGQHVVLALMRASAEARGSLNVEEALLPLVYGLFNRAGVLASGTEMSTGTDFGTERSGTEKSGGVFASGTEMSTGTDFGTERSGTEKSGGIFASGTEMSTGTDFGTERSGTERSGGIFSAIFGGIFASGTEMSTGTDFGTERSGTEKSGGIFESGTEMSTGTDFGTERSGTEKSGRVFAPSYVLVTLEALAQYAAQLRDAGALNVVRSE